MKIRTVYLRRKRMEGLVVLHPFHRGRKPFDETRVQAHAQERESELRRDDVNHLMLEHGIDILQVHMHLPEPGL